VYGPERVRGAESATISSPFFLALVDSLGVKQVLRFGRIEYEGARASATSTRAKAPARFSLVASREADTVKLNVDVLDALATEMTASDFRRTFLQMRGRFKLTGRVIGQSVADSGLGFFETYVAQ
jgi:hypothetical protein